LPINDQSYASYAERGTPLSHYNAQAFVFATLAAQNNHVALVQVKAVTNTGADIAAGSVDVQILVNQVDGAGNATPHGIIHNVPYYRLQGGANAIIIDPQVGDIGLAVFADRDISSVKVNKAQSNPGSSRRFSAADALYLGGYLNGVPNQIVEFNAAGITVTSPTKVTINAPNIALNATAAVAITSPALSHNGSNVGSTHTHPYLQGPGPLVETGPPE
jgi:Phage protein Gp138 N-terminal domain